MSSTDRREAFERAWKASSGSAKMDRYRRQGFMAIASDDPELADVADRLSAGGRAQLELHIDEPSSADHEVRAGVLGAFMSRATRAVNELTKAQLGRDRWRQGLRVLAPALGSVQITFVEPPPRDSTGGQLGVGHVPAPEAEAMRQLTALLILAEADDEALDATVYRLRGPARRAVRLMSETVVDASWTVEGELRLLHRDPVRFAITTEGVSRLARASKETEDEPVRADLAGQVDGWTWSTSSMRFLPDSGRAFDVAVPPELEDLAARANAGRERVHVRLSGVRVHPAGDSATVRTSYWLDALEVDAQLDTGL
ncbi:hypothetical protein [Cellulomonas triticagri]|uniref:Uncharacterized protein n=1 Tax=Cellulomonas triticagri TaxID=2483352 RepID=A0A3M2JQJ2_9CELL|nr:hypothetical protein [Cellulomonas triticagri]RMI13005.1 hypothetical protein EBM89_06270 [Cellulomonas triticagri]